MKPEFRLQKIWDGWTSVRSPDNIEFELILSERKSFIVSASILELVELYNQVQANEECDIMIGTGNIIQIESRNGGVTFMFDKIHSINSTFSALEKSIEQLLQDIFSELGSPTTEIPSYEQEAYPCIEETYQNIINT